MRGRDAPGVAVPAAAGDLATLVNSPRFSQVVIGRRGDPVTMVVPDPRALALHKLWLSSQEDRDPLSKPGTGARPSALAALILRYLPQYYFFSTQLHLFPAEVAGLAESWWKAMRWLRTRRPTNAVSQRYLAKNFHSFDRVSRGRLANCPDHGLRNGDRILADTPGTRPYRGA